MSDDLIPQEKPVFSSAWESDSARISVPVERNSGWSFWVLLWADRHWDNPDSDHKMMNEQLRQARKMNAAIIDVGDFFCAMQGKYDPRSSKSALRPEHTSGDYLDALVNTATDYLSPYADLFAWMCPGNHEKSIHDRRETNLTERLVSNLRAKGSQCIRHRYSGFTRICFKDAQAKSRSAGYSQTVVMWHTHGYGGGGPVTKDTIQANRQGVYLDNVDIVVSGHTHDSWIWPQSTVRVNQYGSIVHNERLHLKIPSAKNKFGKDSWEDLRGMPPKPLGCLWLKFTWDPSAAKVKYDARRSL